MNANLPVCVSAPVALLVLAGCAHIKLPNAAPVVQARVKSVLVVDGLQFKDLNGNGRLDVYEDWRQPVDKRIDDLLAQMSAQEKAFAGYLGLTHSESARLGVYLWHAGVRSQSPVITWSTQV